MSIHDILKQSITTDILEHFIKHITMLQDWERIMVWELKINNEKAESKAFLKYCYKREEENNVWVRCSDSPENPDKKNIYNIEKCKKCKSSNNGGEKISYFDKLNKFVEGNDGKHFNIKNAKRKVLLKDIFNKRLIPELYDYDVNEYKNTRLIFEYPCYTVFPKDEKTSNKLGLHYERQQIDILRQMALQLKVKRETVKHGTKSAVLSIDVRNLSHNIGSHVLAYWIQELNQLLQDYSGDNGKLQTALNKSKALFRYIQHRADFLAEVATSIPCSEMTFNLKKDILNPFLKDEDSGNPYNINADNTKDGLTFDSNVYVLLLYIADSEGITINFNETNKVKKMITCNLNGESQPFWVSIPSGLIGKHAIYSILENFIRNAAKHYKGDEKDGETFIKINVENHNEDYIKVEITDIRRDSCKPKYVEDLNKFIEGGFVDEQGRLKSGGWGIKEMLVSANFLRKNTPEDLYDIITKRKTCNPRLLEIICSNNTDKTENPSNTSCDRCSYNKNLGIRFYLKRPKHLAVLVNGNLKSNIKKNVFEIKNITAAEFKDKPIPYNILLVDEKTYNDKYKDKDDPLAPCRVMYYDGTEKLKDCMEVYNKKNPNDGMITDEYYLCLYEKFIREEIGCNSCNPLPKIYNNIGGYEYDFTANSSLSVDSMQAQDLGCIICFYSHPEAVASRVTAEDYFNNCLYFQPMSGGFSTKAKFHLNKSIMPELLKCHFYLELIEAALTKVVIVDERISEWAGKQSKYFYDKPVREMLKKMNVYVPEIKKDNITAPELNKILSNETLGCEVLSNNKKNPHFFVIHQGVLDKLENKGIDFMKNAINCKWKVIDSGRGVPEEMEYRFVQISALQTLLENYDKHGLVQTLFSLRKPVKEGQSGNHG